VVARSAVTRQNSRRSRSLGVYCATNKIETFDDRDQVRVGLPNNLGSRASGPQRARGKVRGFLDAAVDFLKKASKIATMTITSKRLSGLSLLWWIRQCRNHQRNAARCRDAPERSHRCHSGARVMTPPSFVT
jgi:hypothetical protein